MKEKLKKGKLLVSVGEPMYVRHAKNEKHNEVTVVVLKLAMPLRPVTGCVTPAMLKAISKVSVGFPDANIDFNFKAEAPAVLFTVKGKTECRGADTPNQKIGDEVALAKAQYKAAVIAERLTSAIAASFRETAENVEEVASYFSRFAEQEKSYVDEEKYMRVLEKKA